MRSATPRSAARAAAAALAVALGAAGCARPGATLHAVRPLRLGEVADAGDAARRASTRVALEGLDADARGEPEAALERIETALRIDPTNPWAFLALARHRAEGIAPEAALAPLDQAETLLRLEGELDPRVEVHLLGLRGVAVAASGDAERGRALVREAARRSPATWGDGRLDAAELR